MHVCVYTHICITTCKTCDSEKTGCLDRELFVYFRSEDKLEKLELRYLSIYMFIYIYIYIHDMYIYIYIYVFP